MNTEKPNILQIDQYLNGKLDARAMHKPEWHTQDNPILLWRILPLAASILILLGAGYCFFKSKPGIKQYTNAIATIKKSGGKAGPGIRVGMAPTILRNEPHFDGPTPTFKKDTIEYIADDYAVKPDATVESLLKKMVGFEVDNSIIFFQGQLVTKAKLNGKDFGGGNLSAAIKTLPAETIEKILIVTEKNDIVARTSVQTAEAELVLNLITYTNKKAFMAAKRTIRGKVTDNRGAVLIGAKIRVFGKEGKGVETDKNGNFKIDLPNRKDMLTADYVGHGHKHIKVGVENNLNIVLEQ